MSSPLENTGFTPPSKRRSPALAELVTSAGLALATIVTAIAVSAGVARASVIDGVVGNEGGVFALALLLGLVFIGMGGLSLPGGRPKKH